jgi:hypothetical protein
MDLVNYVTCKVTFQSADKYGTNQEDSYSDRTLVELRQDGRGQHFLRAVDVKNNKAV